MKKLFCVMLMLLFGCLPCFAANTKKDLEPVDPDMLAWSASQCFKAIRGGAGHMSGDLRKAAKYLKDYAETSKAIKDLRYDCEFAIDLRDGANHIIMPYLEAAARKGDETAIDIINLSKLSRAWIIDADYELSNMDRESAEKLRTSSQIAIELSKIAREIEDQSGSERAESMKQAKLLYEKIDNEKYPLAHCAFADVCDKFGNYQDAIHYWELCANSGYPGPAFKIGEIYEQGYKEGIKKNFKKAMEWYEKGLKNSVKYIADDTFSEYGDKYLEKIKKLKEKIELIEDYEKNGE